MQFAVIGAGNVGSIYGGNLARVGAQVCLIDPWQEHIDQINRHGLELDGLNGHFTAAVSATVDAASAPKADVALICVSNYATADAAASAAQVLKDGGYALTLQNGLGHLEILADVLGRDRVLGGLTFHSADIVEPGKVMHTNRGPTYLGELDAPRSPRVETLYTWFQKAEMDPVVPDDILVTIWSKFVHNCGLNAICAITGLRPGHIRAVPELDEFQTQIIMEVLALVQAKGITLPDPAPLETIKAYSAQKFHRVSMLQHLDRQRRTEIDALNGYVVQESQKLGLDAPYNEALTKLMKGREYVPGSVDMPAA